MMAFVFMFLMFLVTFGSETRNILCGYETLKIGASKMIETPKIEWFGCLMCLKVVDGL